ncbi:hypothetical protein AGLY_012520, partial [Aphis glycines]
CFNKKYRLEKIWKTNNNNTNSFLSTYNIKGPVQYIFYILDQNYTLIINLFSLRTRQFLEVFLFLLFFVSMRTVTFLIILSSSSICNGGFRKASKVSHMVGKRFLRSEYDFSEDFKIIYHQIKIYPKTSTKWATATFFYHSWTVVITKVIITNCYKTPKCLLSWHVHEKKSSNWSLCLTISNDRNLPCSIIVDKHFMIWELSITYISTNIILNIITFLKFLIICLSQLAVILSHFRSRSIVLLADIICFLQVVTLTIRSGIGYHLENHVCQALLILQNRLEPAMSWHPSSCLHRCRHIGFPFCSQGMDSPPSYYFVYYRDRGTQVLQIVIGKMLLGLASNLRTALETARRVGRKRNALSVHDFLFSPSRTAEDNRTIKKPTIDGDDYECKTTRAIPSFLIFLGRHSGGHLILTSNDNDNNNNNINIACLPRPIVKSEKSEPEPTINAVPHKIA